MLNQGYHSTEMGNSDDNLNVVSLKARVSLQLRKMFSSGNDGSSLYNVCIHVLAFKIGIQLSDKLISPNICVLV